MEGNNEILLVFPRVGYDYRIKKVALKNVLKHFLELLSIYKLIKFLPSPILLSLFLVPERFCNYQYLCILPKHSLNVHQKE